ncbi:MAG: SDR family oxidoreductase [Bacteroidota bacterium]
MKISILGCGWLGMPLAEHLTKVGYKVKGSTTSTDKLPSIKAAGVEAYLIKLDGSKINAEFLNSDVIIINVPPSKNNNIGFIDILKSLRSQIERSTISKVLYVSSTSVYPSNNEEVTEIDATYIRTSRSGVSMLATEDIWRDSSHFDHFILRFAGLFGPKRNPGRFLSGKETTGGQNPVNMIHLNDCINIIEKLLLEKNWNDTFNACSPHHPSRKDFYLQASKYLNIDPPVFTEPKITEHKIVNATKLTQRISYEYHHENLFEAIELS